jgi:hypothetical protein
MVSKIFYDFHIAERTFLSINFFRIELRRKPSVVPGIRKVVAGVGDLP